MKSWKNGIIAGLILLPALTLLSYAGSVSLIPSTGGGIPPSQILPVINGWIQNSLNPANTAQNTAFYSYPRNIIDNGGFAIQQRGTGTATCATTTVTLAAYSADRWLCDVNVSGGAGRATPQTSSLPPGFVGGMLLARNATDTHTQPVCLMQEIPTVKIVQLQNSALSFSAYLKAGNNFSAASAAVNWYVWTGTNADEGITGSTGWASPVGMTASPAVTPALTGLATAGSGTWNITTSWARYTSGTANINIPSTAKEAVVAICFTPVGTAVATDGVYMTGTQLEYVPQAYAGSFQASPFEFRPYQQELTDSQAFYVPYAEPASGIQYYASCTGNVSATTASDCWLALPVSAYGVMVATGFTAGGLKATDNTSGAATAVSALSVASGGASAGSNMLHLSTTNTSAAGVTGMLISSSTTGKFAFSSDF